MSDSKMFRGHSFVVLPGAGMSTAVSNCCPISVSHAGANCIVLLGNRRKQLGISGLQLHQAAAAPLTMS